MATNLVFSRKSVLLSIDLYLTSRLSKALYYSFTQPSVLLLSSVLRDIFHIVFVYDLVHYSVAIATKNYSWKFT